MSRCSLCDVQPSKILFLILIFKRNFLFGLAGPELHWQWLEGCYVRNSGWHPAPCREVLIPRELSLPRELWGCVDSLPSAPCQVQEPPRGTCRSWLCSHAPQTLANFQFSLSVAPTRVKQRSQPAPKPPRYQQFYFSSDTLCNRESCANTLEKVRGESK